MAEDIKNDKGETKEETPRKEELKAEYLKGLTFATAEPRKTKNEDGRDSVKYVPIERALKISDVLDWKDCGAEIVIVAADGQKHRVAKKESKK